MHLLIVSTPELSRKALLVLDQTQWRVVVPSLFSDTWLASGNNLPVATLKQYLQRFDKIYTEEGLKIEAITLLQHAIETLSIAEYHLCDFESIDDILLSIQNGYFVDKNHANAKHAEYTINTMFINRFSKAVKLFTIENRLKTHKQNFQRASYEEINRLTKTWHKQLQNYFVLLPTLAGLYWIVKAERNIRAYDPKNINRIYVQYKKEGVEFTIPYNTVYSDEFIQERNDAIEYLRNTNNKHIVNFYQSEVKEVKPFYKPIALSFLQSKMFYLYHFPIEYTTKIAKRLYHAGLITDPLTSSHHIPSEMSIALIRYLNIKYGEEYVLQHEREYKNQEEGNIGTAILPMFYEEAYDPENVEHTPQFLKINFENTKMKNDTLIMYSFIYAITEWIQMKNAIYDSSILQIHAGNKKLEVKANQLVEVYSQEKQKYIEQKCWKSVNIDLLNALSASGDGEISDEGFAVVIPRCSFGEVLQLTGVDSTVSKPKRPPRYGVGRFNTQILGGKGIGTAESFHIIQNNLISSDLVSLASTMMHPQDIAMETIEWCEKYAPQFLSEKHILEYWERLDRIRFEGESQEQLIGEYQFLIDEILKEAGEKEHAATLSDGQIKLAKAIAIQRKIPIDNPEIFFADPHKVKQLIDLYGHDEPKEEEKLFKCPICRQGYVFEKEYVNTETGQISPYYACENSNCFRIFDNKIDEFFISKKKNFDKSERLEALKNIASKQHLKNSGYLFTGFVGKNEKIYDAKVFINTFTAQSGSINYGLKIEF